MLRTVAALMLMTPAVGMAQESRDIEPGQSLSGTLSRGDPTQYDRAYDDYRYEAAAGTRARVVVRSSEMAVDVSIYFYDDYFDFIPLIAGGSAVKDSLDFTVPDVGTPVTLVLRVSTLADDPGPGTGDYTIELSEPQDPSGLPGYIEQSFPVRSPLTHPASICHSGSSMDCHLRGPLCVYDPPPSEWSGLSIHRL